MRTFTGVFRRDCRELVRTYKYLPLALIAVCVLFALSLPSTFSATVKPFSLVICPGNDELIAPALEAMLENHPMIGRLRSCDEEEAFRLLENGGADAVVVLPDDIEQSLIYNGRVNIRVAAARQVEGTLLYSLAKSAADAMNVLQTAVYTYYETVPYGYDTGKTLTFDQELILDALTRSTLIVYHDVPEPYTVQISAIILFLTLSTGAVCVSAVTAAQLETGGIRRMYAAGANRYAIVLAKLAEAVLAGLLLLAPFAADAVATGFIPSVLRLAAAAVAVAALCAPLYLLCALFAKNSMWALSCMAGLLLVSLFTGGGVYPPYLTGFSLPSPAYAAYMLAGWVLC